MSRIKKIRNSADGALDRWQTKAEAMEAQFDASKDQVMARVEKGKEAYLDTIDKAKVSINESKALTQEKKQKIQTRLDETRLQIALGKAESADAFQNQKEKIQKELAGLEKQVDAEIASWDSEIDASLDKVAKELVASGNVLNAEMEAASTKLDALKGNLTDKVEAAKGEVADFKLKIQAKRDEAVDSASVFESEFSEGWQQIKSSFKNLK